MHPRVPETYSNHLNPKYWIYYAISNSYLDLAIGVGLGLGEKMMIP